LPHDLMHRFLSWWYLGYNNAFRYDDFRQNRGSIGLGKNISMSFESYLREAQAFTKAGDNKTSGNGSIMRNAAIPICFYKNIEIACEMAVQQSRVTHQGAEAADCCRLLTYITVHLLKYRLNDKKYSLKDILDYVGDSFCKKFPDSIESVKCLAASKPETNGFRNIDEDRNWNWKANIYPYSRARSLKQPGYFGAYSMDAMALALHVLYHTKTFEEAILRVVNMRGDSDSVGAVVGQMAGAWYGILKIPPKWIEVLKEWDHGEIALRGYMLARIGEGKSYIINPEQPVTSGSTKSGGKSTNKNPTSTIQQQKSSVSSSQPVMPPYTRF